MNEDESPPPFPIHDLRSELPRHKSVSWATRDIKTISTTVVHHTATEMRAGDTTRSHIYAINKGHIEKQGWPSIAYHYVVGRQGVVWQCNDLRSRTYHSGNAAMNGRSVGVCLVGKFINYPPTEEQMQALRWLVGQLGYPAIGHKEVVRTACPGTWWDANRAWVNGELGDVEAVQVEPETWQDDAAGCRLALELVWSWLTWQASRLREWLRGEGG